jgi:hypothetical protein
LLSKGVYRIVTRSKWIFSVGVFALAVASAASSYQVTFFQSSLVGNTEIKPGDYKVELDGEKAVIKTGKTSVQAACKVETGTEKYATTVVRYSNGDGKYRVQEIRLGGTKTKLVFNN